MSTDAQATPWYELKATELATAAPHDDFLHPKLNALVQGDSVSETQYFGFNIPEERIHGICYIWHHPHLGVVTGGVWVWQGRKRHNFQSEIFDMITWESDDCLAGDLHEVELSNSYRSEVIEALHRHRISYRDPVRDHSIDISYQATMPAVLMKNGLHLEQGMRAQGTLTLSGKSYDIDCVTVRDRSWGAVRPERHTQLPPAAWTCCVFSDDFAFAYFAFDSLDTNPEWKEDFSLPPTGNLVGGWVWRDGELHGVTEVTQRTHHDFDTLFPTTVTSSFTDTTGRRYQLTGTITAAGNWHTWMNFEGAYCGAHYECDGHTGYGDFQEVQGLDYMQRFLGRTEHAPDVVARP